MNQLSLFKLAKTKPPPKLTGAEWRALTALTINPKPIEKMSTRVLRKLISLKMLVVTAHSPALYKVTALGNSARQNGAKKK